MNISENLKFKGDLKFEKFLRVNGQFEGRVIAPSTVSDSILLNDNIELFLCPYT